MVVRLRMGSGVVVLLACLLGPAPAARGQDLSLDVNAAIDQGITRLRELQGADGTFALFGPAGGDSGRYPMGYVALPVYTLLESGVRADDPAVQRGLEHLAALPFRQVYSVSVYVLALNALGADLDEAQAERLRAAAAWLESVFDADQGLWAYPEGAVELSNTQYAVMALWAAEAHGHEVSPGLWPRLVEGTLGQQLSDGGFRYRPNHHQLASGSMTAAGLAVLYACLAHLDAGRQHAAARAAAEDALERGWGWFERHITVTGNPYGPDAYLRDRGATSEWFTYGHDYYLLSLQRACVLGERRRVAGLDWYRAGARELLSRQESGGGWHNLEATCFAMLFLRRATLSGVGAVVKVDARTAARSEAATLPSVTWKVRAKEPGKGWTKTRFKDDRWTTAEAPVVTGSDAWPAAESEVWLRRAFELPLPEGAALELWCQHDDGVTLWIDGEEVGRSATFSSGRYRRFALAPEVLADLEPGRHVLAAHVVNTGGPGSFDLRFGDPTSGRRGAPGSGPSWFAEPSPAATLLRRWLSLGPVGEDDASGLGDAALTAVTPGEGRRDLGGRWDVRRGLSGRLDSEAGKDGGVGLAACWLHVEERTRAVLWFAARHGVRAWLGEVPVLNDHTHRELTRDELPVVVDLTPGSHRLLVAYEILDGGGALAVRISDALGGPQPVVAVSLDPDDPQAAAQALAQPESLAPAWLVELLPAGHGTSLGFGRPDDLATVAVGPVGLGGVAHVPKSKPSRGTAQPHPGGRGLLMLRPPAGDVPVTLSWAVPAPGRQGRLEARVSADVAAGPSGGARVRLGILDAAGGERWLAEQVVAHDGGKPSSRGWLELSAELPGDVTWPAVVRLEVASATGHLGGSTVFVDTLALP